MFARAKPKSLFQKTSSKSLKPGDMFSDKPTSKDEEEKNERS
jgi:hypothetical protein